MEFLLALISPTIMAEALGPDWPFQAVIYVEGASRPLDSSASVEAHPGCLIEVVAKGERRYGPRLLKDQLTHADACLRGSAS